MNQWQCSICKQWFSETGTGYEGKPCCLACYHAKTDSQFKPKSDCFFIGGTEDGKIRYLEDKCQHLTVPLPMKPYQQMDDGLVVTKVDFPVHHYNRVPIGINICGHRIVVKNVFIYDGFRNGGVHENPQTEEFIKFVVKNLVAR